MVVSQVVFDLAILQSQMWCNDILETTGLHPAFTKPSALEGGIFIPWITYTSIWNYSYLGCDPEKLPFAGLANQF